jgi:hypothetical protein
MSCDPDLPRQVCGCRWCPFGSWNGERVRRLASGLIGKVNGWILRIQLGMALLGAFCWWRLRERWRGVRGLGVV